MNITAPCINRKDVCVLSYSLNDLAWQCTECSTLFEVPDGDRRVDDGRHVDWHKDESADNVVMADAAFTLPSIGGMG